ncbi:MULTISPECIES: hypothetical protein [Paenibacillus]|uniref:phage lytic cycle repressor MrpR family protein n=1 Tax=Paenibacillus TaxID=44249 RepID=UPI0019160DFF|nr:hypothetical protein [Paenibacillus sp. EPM92]
MTVLFVEKLLFVESQSVNPQDAIIIRLLMEGVGVHELVYLTKDSLDITNRMLTLKDAYDIERKIPVTRKCVELFQSAVEQTKYILQNGYNQTRQNSVNLRDSRFLIKVSVQDYIANESMITELDSVILRVIYMRLKRLAEFFSMPELTHFATGKPALQTKVYA